MCKFCTIPEELKEQQLVELPYFHTGPNDQTGMKLIRYQIGNQAIWNLVCDFEDINYTTFAFFCPRCGKKLADFYDSDVNIVSSELNQNDTINE